MYNYDYADKIKDFITLDNGNKVQIQTLGKNGIIFSKLQSLRDKTGKWIRSRLIYFNCKGKKSYVLESYNKEN